MDNELFELCKQVYEKTGWGAWSQPDGDSDQTESYWKHLDGETENEAFKSAEHSKWSKAVWIAPLYTSDYLLEKLPWSTVCSGPNEGMFGSWMNGKPKETFNEADTPLKALLKLTLALHEAGQLDKENK